MPSLLFDVEGIVPNVILSIMFPVCRGADADAEAVADDKMMMML